MNARVPWKHHSQILFIGVGGVIDTKPAALVRRKRRSGNETKRDTDNISVEVAVDAQESSTPVKRSIAKKVGFFLLNCWLIVHLTGIVTAPATVGPSSQTARNVWEVVGPYLQLLYLNHGFHFFAPQPGSSNLVSWAVTTKSGETVSGRFPNFDIKPRLLYHRHFMLSEFLGNNSPEMQAVIVKGFARNLCREYDGVQVSLSTVRHELSTMERVRAGGKLTDGDLYEEQPLGTFTWEELQ
ncbi:MAG: hypothetical protein KDA81_08325 [Planctomycetaceae bacterium]|nr:hypothetical protein [Planctomycetaceae bacterium]